MNNGTILLMLALILLAGIIFGKLAKLVRLPSVTGYLLAGILFGPSLLGSLNIGGITLGLSEEFIGSVGIIYTVAFSFICFSLGEEIKPKSLKALGGRAFVISLVQSLGAVVLVSLTLTLFAFVTHEKYITYPVALILGALAAASAPTAKYMITRQYKTEGEITDMMVPVVALDDIFGIIVFAVIIAILPTFSGGAVSIYSLLLAPIIEVVLSLTIGIVMGVALGYLTKIFKIQWARVGICIAFVLLAVAVTEIFNDAELYLVRSAGGHGEGHVRLSSLLVSIVMGGAFSFVNHEHGIRKRLDSWTYPMFVVFFVLAGARMNLSHVILLDIFLVAAIYIIFRFFGKYYGARLGSSLMRESKNMRKYLGFTLLPQADVAIGMAAMASVVLASKESSLVEGVVFVAAVVFEIMGHIFIRIGLKKAGETHGDLDAANLKFSRRRFKIVKNSDNNHETKNSDFF